MPRNPHKRPCQVPGCKAWARHGERLCASHLSSRAIGGDVARVLPLLRLTASGGAALGGRPSPDQAAPASQGLAGSPDGEALATSSGVPTASAVSSAADLAVIDQELRQLLEARALFMDWLRDLRADEDPARPAVTPTQFLRAWSDSATRVVQLLRARAELRGDEGGALGALLDSVYDELDALLATAPAAPEPADGHHPQ